MCKYVVMIIVELIDEKAMKVLKRKEIGKPITNIFSISTCLK